MRIKFKDIMEIVNIKKIIKEFPKIGKILALLPVDNIGSLSTELKLIIVLLVRVIKFEYKVQVTTFIYVLFAAVYICVPTDIIMDFIPVVGYIDDAALVSFLVKIIFDEIANFKKSVNIEEVNFFEEIKISKEALEH